MFELSPGKTRRRPFHGWILVAIGCAATILTVAMPLLQTDTLGRRMKAVSTEREKIRQRERDRIAANQNQKQNKAQLRVAPKRLFKDVVDRLSLTTWLGTDSAKMQLAQAGYRGAGAEYTFLFFRLVTPIALFLLALLYMFVIIQWDKPFLMKLGIAIGAMYGGIKAPELFLSNTITKRRKQMERAYPNTLDLLLICVESGMSLEHAFRKVSIEIGTEIDRDRRGAGPARRRNVVPAGPAHRLRESRHPHRAAFPARAGDRARPVRALRHSARRRAARPVPGEPRRAHDRGGEEGRRAAAGADRADDPVLPAGPVRGDPDAGDHPDQSLDLTGDFAGAIQRRLTAVRTAA